MTGPPASRPGINLGSVSFRKVEIEALVRLALNLGNMLARRSSDHPLSS